MPLEEDYLRMVVFLLDEDGGAPTGTGFLITVPAEFGDAVFTYLVAAKHVIDKASSTYMRFRTVSGAIHDTPLEQWEFHDTEDIAIQKVDFAHIDPQPVYNAYQFEDAIDHHPLPGDHRLLGERIYFIGILEQLKSTMGKTMIPMVRSGTIGALNQPDVPLENGTLVTAHLIDGRSLSGFSGAPCFVQQQYVFNGPDGPEIRVATRMLGIVVAHFDHIPDASGGLPLKLNTGVVAVVPVERIRELIERDDMKQDRREWLEKCRMNHPVDFPAPLDAMEPDGSDNTTDLMRNPLQAPKDELKGDQS